MASGPDLVDKLQVPAELRPAPYKHETTGKAQHPPGDFKKAGFAVLFFGVLVPAAAIFCEWNFHLCAQSFFDPLPTFGHLLLVSLIPLSNFLYWLATRRDMSDHYAFIALSNGMAMGVGFLYTLMFLPLMPMGLLYVILLGAGLLLLSPILSLPFTWMTGRGICKLADMRRSSFNAHQVKHLGHLIILVMVVAIELPSTLTRMHLSEAANDATAAGALPWLRTFGNEEVMLRACYERCGRATDIVGSLYDAAHPLAPENARRIFYRVTGKPFNSVPIPAAARATMVH
ncbi:MAG: hypothetical protein ACRD3W_00925, partial [Terriglobales bacterium]